MNSQLYRRPPITEAIIEIRFASPLAPAEVEKLSYRLASCYPNEQPIQNLDVALAVPIGGLAAQPTAQVNQMLGQRRSTSDQTEIVLIWPSTFLLSQLAPYPGWEIYFARFVRDWQTLKRATDYRKILQIGVRFVNRIDVLVSNNTLPEAEYLNVYPKLPDALGALYGYSVQVQVMDRELECTTIINSAVIPSPLIGHGALMLDIYTVKVVDPPQNDDDLYEWLNRIRVKKNATFEACVTDRTRELFQT